MSKSKAHKRRVIRVESEETQDCVRGSLAHEEISQEEADEIGFVPSSASEPRGVYYWCDNRCSDIEIVIEEGGESRTINLSQRCYNEKLVQHTSSH